MNPVKFRCIHRHNGISHPKCYLAYLNGGKFQQVRHKRSARILLLDIETLPGEWYAFNPKVDYLNSYMMIKDWSIACWSAKWLCEPEIFGQTVTAQEAFDRTEESIVGGIWKMMDEANIIIHQNGTAFDLPKLNTKFLKWGLRPVSSFQSVDTLLSARSTFGNSYNSLNELANWLGIGVQKTKMSVDDWKACLTNNSSATKALNHMLDYCKRDVAPLLEDVYLTMLPYIKGHPNLGLWNDSGKDTCRNCESTDIRWVGEYSTAQGLWESYRCDSCGNVGRGHGKEHKIKSVTVS